MSTETKQSTILKDGEHLSKRVYLERYEAAPEDFRAELLEGIVYVNAAAAARMEDHGRPQYLVMRWLAEFEDDTPGVMISGPSTTDISDDSMPEPDICMIIDHPKLGQTFVDERGYCIGPPELVVEIAASTVRKDTIIKKRIYEKAGVKEYIIWQTVGKKLDWFVLHDGKYEELMSDEIDGLLKSKIFPGLWLDRQALINRDIRGVLNSMQPGLESVEHQIFRETLKEL